MLKIYFLKNCTPDEDQSAVTAIKKNMFCDHDNQSTVNAIKNDTFCDYNN